MSGLTPERVADAVRRRLEDVACEVSAFWVQVPHEREAYAAALRKELEAEPVVVEVIRDSSFDNPNAVLDDFVRLVDQVEKNCRERIERGAARCGFVLLSRTELAVAQISSPVNLPTWFPIRGGETVSFLIEDLTWTADAPLAAPELGVGELAESLYELDDAITLRIQATKQADHRKVSGFTDLIRLNNDERLDAILAEAAEHRASVTTPSSFRPSLRDGRSLTARLWRLTRVRQPDDLAVPSRLLADAMGLPGALDRRWHESVHSVLARPSGGEPAPRLRFARNLLWTVGATCQLVTAAAHSDDYAHYPVALLRGLSFDLRRSIADAETVLRTLD